MLSGEAKYQRDNSRQILEAASTEITQENFKWEFLDTYFPDNVRSKEEIKFLELKQANMTMADYAAKLEELSGFSLITRGQEVKDLNV